MNAEKRIFGEAFSSGILVGVGIKTGILVDEGSIITMIMESLCKATENIQTSFFNCWGFLTLISLLVLLTSCIAIFEAITNTDDWRVGVMIYGFGFVLGIFLIIFV